MSSDAVSNPPTAAPGESKSARKKKAKGDAATAVPALAEKATSEFGTNGSEAAGKAAGAEENSYIKELQKSVILEAAPLYKLGT